MVPLNAVEAGQLRLHPTEGRSYVVQDVYGLDVVMTGEEGDICTTTDEVEGWKLLEDFRSEGA